MSNADTQPSEVKIADAGRILDRHRQAGAGARAANIYLQFGVEGGTGRVLAYGVAVDNTSGDAIYLPAQREP